VRRRPKRCPTEWGGGGIGSEFAWQTTIPGTGWSSPIVVGKSIWLTSAEQTALSDRGRQKKLAENPILTPRLSNSLFGHLAGLRSRPENGQAGFARWNFST
jgi:hypothetical protein